MAADFGLAWGRFVCRLRHLVPSASCALRQTDMALIMPPAGPSVVLAAHSTVRAPSAQIPVPASANTLPQPAPMASIPTGLVSAIPAQGLLNQVSCWSLIGSVQSMVLLTDSTYGSSTSIKQPTLTLQLSICAGAAEWANRVLLHRPSDSTRSPHIRPWNCIKHWRRSECPSQPSVLASAQVKMRAGAL